jgi:hypothetical protein
VAGLHTRGTGTDLHAAAHVPKRGGQRRHAQANPGGVAGASAQAGAETSTRLAWCRWSPEGSVLGLAFASGLREAKSHPQIGRRIVRHYTPCLRLEFPLTCRQAGIYHRDVQRTKMAETTINFVDALRGQQEQLKRLLKQKILISNAPKATLSEIEAQINELKRLLARLESDIQDQIRRGQ